MERVNPQTLQELCRDCSQLYESYSGLYDYVSGGNKDIPNRLDIILEELNSLGRGVRVLEVGCMDGYFSHHFSKGGHIAVGVDMVELWVEKAKVSDSSDAEFVQAFGEMLPFSEESFDVVYLGQVLEHVFDVSKVLEEVFRVLKVGGKVLVTVPASLGNDPMHLREFSLSGLRDVLGERFEVYSSGRTESGRLYCFCRK